MATMLDPSARSLVDVNVPLPSSSLPLSDDGTARSAMTSMPYGYAVTTASFFTFLVIHGIVGRLQPPKSVVTRGDHWKWTNIAVSWIHSSFSGVCSAYSFYNYPEVLDDLVEVNNPFIYTIASISTGYFIYDFYDIVANGQARSQWEVLLHHVAVLNSFIYNVTQCRFIGYTIVALFVEVNSIFLHMRKLLQMGGYYGYNSITYRAVLAANLVTFILCRFIFSLSLITHGIIFYPWKMSTYYYWSLSTTMLLTWIVNILLFWRVVKNDYLRRRRPQSQKQATNGLASSQVPTVDANSNGQLSAGDNNSHRSKCRDEVDLRRTVDDSDVKSKQL